MKLIFPDGNVREYPSGTNGREIALSISEGLARNALGIFLNGKKYDLNAPLNEDGEIKIVTFDDDEGKEIYWHSSAHLMAEAIQEMYPGVRFGIGPPIENGFYYDIDLPDDKRITQEDLPKIEEKMRELSKKKSDYVRRDLPWDEAYEYFSKVGDPYKLELLEGLRGENISFYEHGHFTDLCRGTHIPNTGAIKAIKLLSVAGAYWRGDSDRKMMTRIYGITFPKQKLLDEFLFLREEAEKRDHRKIGKELNLFMITPEVGAGLPVWLPKGAAMRRLLERWMRKEQKRRGYVEVITPHLGNLNMYKRSGHYPYYAESQFPPMKIENEEYLLKPMNCPHHHQIYMRTPKSYKELPLRLFEYGSVYRYEQSGELTGLTRVRGFTQDDAHIYCTPDQLKEEIKGVVDLTRHIYEVFGMEFICRLSFRDEESSKYGGDTALWDRAQKEIQEAADELGLNYTVAKGEAAFYGPKIDFIIKDAIGRKWQLGTVQVDYVMPERFELEFTGPDNAPHRPVIIHRAPFGSMERFFAILIEHYAGAFPFWLAPVQVNILPIGLDQTEYANNLKERLEELGYRVEIDTRSEKINRKIAESEQQKVPFALVIGAKEVESGSASVREHKVGDRGAMKIEELLAMFEDRNKPGKQ